jgi:hypothetical protein
MLARIRLRPFSRGFDTCRNARVRPARRLREGPSDRLPVWYRKVGGRVGGKSLQRDAPVPAAVGFYQRFYRAGVKTRSLSSSRAGAHAGRPSLSGMAWDSHAPHNVLGGPRGVGNGRVAAPDDTYLRTNALAQLRYVPKPPELGELCSSERGRDRVFPGSQPEGWSPDPAESPCNGS